MGKTFEKVRIWNVMDEEGVRKGIISPIEVSAQIDNGSTTVILTEGLAKSLNLPREDEKVWVRYANGTREQKEVAIGLRVEIMGRKTVCRAIIEPNRDSPLIGQIVLEDLDLWIDSKNGKLVPNPESPEAPMLDAL